MAVEPGGIARDADRLRYVWPALALLQRNHPDVPLVLDNIEVDGAVRQFEMERISVRPQRRQGNRTSFTFLGLAVEQIQPLLSDATRACGCPAA